MKVAPHQIISQSAFGEFLFSDISFLSFCLRVKPAPRLQHLSEQQAAGNVPRFFVEECSNKLTGTVSSE